MGANAKMTLPDTVNRDRLLKECRDVPIDCEVMDGGEVGFHYGYWGDGHARKCEAFVAGVAIGAGVSIPKWRY